MAVGSRIRGGSGGRREEVRGGERMWIWIRLFSFDSCDIFHKLTLIPCYRITR